MEEKRYSFQRKHTNNGNGWIEDGEGAGACRSFHSIGPQAAKFGIWMEGKNSLTDTDGDRSDQNFLQHLVACLISVGNIDHLPLDICSGNEEINEGTDEVCKAAPLTLMRTCGCTEGSVKIVTTLSMRSPTIVGEHRSCV